MKNLHVILSVLLISPVLTLLWGQGGLPPLWLSVPIFYNGPPFGTVKTNVSNSQMCKHGIDALCSIRGHDVYT